MCLLLGSITIATANRRSGAQFQRSYNENAVPLSPKQKLQIALRTAIDPVAFGVAGFDAAAARCKTISPGMARDSGIRKALRGFVCRRLRWHLVRQRNLSYLVEGGSPILPARHRKLSPPPLLLLSTTVWSKRDNGTWGPNYSNVLGNLAAGGISNLYYPASDRGADLTFERGFTVTAYGALGGVFNEFWPDVARKIFKARLAKLQPIAPPPTTSAAATPAATQ